MAASSATGLECVKILIEHGAQGWPQAFFMAQQAGNVECTTLLEGLERARAVEAFKTAAFPSIPRVAHCAIADGSSGECECTICLDEFATGETLLKLPCGHALHESCGIKWLRSHNSCPMCRGKLPSRCWSEERQQS